MKKDNGAELFPIVDEFGIVLGSATRAECHSGSKLLHPAVHLHIFNSRGELYLQRRPLWKDIQPGKWDTAVGGHVDFGEKVEDALLREVREEVGLESFTPVPLSPYVFESEVERELVNPFFTVYDGPVRPSDELDGGRFFSRAEIEEMITTGLTTPNFAQEYTRMQLASLPSL